MTLHVVFSRKNKRGRMKSVIGAVVAVGMIVAGVAHAADKKEAPKGPALEKASGLTSSANANWMPMMGDNKAGPWLAPVQGDPKTGAFTAFLKLKGGGDSGWHTHDANYSAIV